MTQFTKLSPSDQNAIMSAYDQTILHFEVPLILIEEFDALENKGIKIGFNTSTHEYNFKYDFDDQTSTPLETTLSLKGNHLIEFIQAGKTDAKYKKELIGFLSQNKWWRAAMKVQHYRYDNTLSKLILRNDLDYGEVDLCDAGVNKPLYVLNDDENNEINITKANIEKQQTLLNQAFNEIERYLCMHLKAMHINLKRKYKQLHTTQAIQNFIDENEIEI